MFLKLPLFIIFFCLIACIYSSQASASSDEDFRNTAVATLQNKKILSDSPSKLYTFAYWQDSFPNFSGRDDIISASSQIAYGRNILSVTLKTYNEYGLVYNFKLDFNSNFVQINQTNATIKFPDVNVYYQDIGCSTDIDIYFAEKTTQLPPQTFDTSNLHAYTKQFRFISAKCCIELTTSFFNDGYHVSLFDKVLFISGCLIYIFASIYSRSTPKPNKRKVSVGTLRSLMFFSYYTLAYMGIWLIKMNMFSDLLYLFIPFLIALLIDFIKHSRDLSKNDGSCCCCLVLALFPAIALAAIPEFGDFLTCLYMLPQVIMKYKERHERQRHLTRFEIGNFTCLSLWVLYLDLYPNNVFLSPPKPVLAFIYITAVLIQLSVLVYLEYGVPREKIFKYTFAVSDSVDKEKFIEEQCAICLSAFEVDTEDGKLYRTPCKHLFHPECLRAWGGRKLECPCCRKRIPNFVESID